MTPKIMSPALAFLSPVSCSDLVILTKLSHRHCTLPVAETERWPSPSPAGPFIGSPSHQMAAASTQLWKLDAQAPSLTPPSPSAYIQSHLTLSLFSSPSSSPPSQPRHHQVLAGPPQWSPDWSSYITIWHPLPPLLSSTQLLGYLSKRPFWSDMNLILECFERIYYS